MTFKTTKEVSIKFYYLAYSFCKTEHATRFIYEMLLNMLHPFPFVDAEFNFVLLGKSIKYRLGTFFAALQFIKLYHVFRLFSVFSRFNSIIASKYCSNLGIRNVVTFALKCEIKEHPFIFLTFSIFNVGFFFGLLLRFFEILDLDNEIKFENFSNGIWVIFVAITTVGYGDIFPQSHIGRLLVVSAIFLGTFLVSLTIVAFTSLSSFDKNELRSFGFLKRIVIKERLKHIAGEIISNHFSLTKTRKLLSNNIGNKEVYQAKSFKIKRQLRRLKLQLSYENYLMTKDTYVSQEDKFIYLESQVDSDIGIIKIGLKNIVETKPLMIEQVSKQRKLLDRLKSLEETTKNLKYEFGKLFYRVGQSDKVEFMNHLDEVEAEVLCEDEDIISISKRSRREEDNAKVGFLLNHENPFMEGSASAFLHSLEMEKQSEREGVKHRLSISCINPGESISPEYSDWMDNNSKQKLESISDRTIFYFNALKSIFSKVNLIGL